MTMCLLCRRSLLVGERYRLWKTAEIAGERAVCRLCEELAEEMGWTRVDAAVRRETGSDIWHARKVA
jgi:hypothetical protein